MFCQIELRDSYSLEGVRHCDSDGEDKKMKICRRLCSLKEDTENAVCAQDVY